MLSQTVEYALRSGLSRERGTGSLQDRPNRDGDARPEGLSLQGIAGVGEGRCRLLPAQTGGGITLAKQPFTLTILEVVNAVEPIARIQTCPLGLESHGTHLCPLHKRLDDALAAMQQAFGGTTLAELLAEPTTSIPLCNFPPKHADLPGTVTQE